LYHSILHVVNYLALKTLPKRSSNCTDMRNKFFCCKCSFVRLLFYLDIMADMYGISPKCHPSSLLLASSYLSATYLDCLCHFQTYNSLSQSFQTDLFHICRRIHVQMSSLLDAPIWKCIAVSTTGLLACQVQVC
jgi:hypothetical protein